MFDYSTLYPLLVEQGMHEWSEAIKLQLSSYFNNIKHGDFAAWKKSITELPKIKPSAFDFKNNIVHIGETVDCNDVERQQIAASLKQLMPWRKGPFSLFGINLDAEWRSDMKWCRLQDHIELESKTILDIGCGNGYYALRMLGSGAKLVVGIDPTLRFITQFEVFKHYLQNIPVYLLPLSIQDLSVKLLSFDIVFSMGVIYHRRDPKKHIQQLYECLFSGGTLVIESLIIDEQYGEQLIPEGRYAKMNNVWWIPSTRMLINLLESIGFQSVRLIDETVTTEEEQRITEWMTFESLKDFLAPMDSTKTIEGYRAPKRAIVLADKP